MLLKEVIQTFPRPIWISLHLKDPNKYRDLTCPRHVIWQLKDVKNYIPVSSQPNNQIGNEKMLYDKVYANHASKHKNHIKNGQQVQQ